jgi:hypothetical protein
MDQTNYYGNGVSIIHAHQRPKPITSTCVPYMHLYDCSIDVYILLHISAPYRDIIVLAKCVPHIPLGYAWFSNTWVSKEHHFSIDYSMRIYAYLELWANVSADCLVKLSDVDMNDVLLLWLFIQVVQIYFFSSCTLSWCDQERLYWTNHIRFSWIFQN